LGEENRKVRKKGKKFHMREEERLGPSKKGKEPSTIAFAWGKRGGRRGSSKRKKLRGRGGSKTLRINLRTARRSIDP